MNTYTSECYIKNCRILLHYSKINLFRSKPFSKYFHCINTREKDSPELSLLIRIRIIIIITHSLSIGDHCRVCFSVYFLYVSLFYYCHFPFFFSYVPLFLFLFDTFVLYSYLYKVVFATIVLSISCTIVRLTLNCSLFICVYFTFNVYFLHSFFLSFCYHWLVLFVYNHRPHSLIVYLYDSVIYIFERLSVIYLFCIQMCFAHLSLKIYQSTYQLSFQLS